MITVPGELAVTLRAQGNSSLHTIQQRPIILVWEASCCVFDPVSFQACCRLPVFWSTLAPGLEVHQPQFARHFSLWSTPTTNDQGNIKSQEGSHLERSGHVRAYRVVCMRYCKRYIHNITQQLLRLCIILLLLMQCYQWSKQHNTSCTAALSAFMTTLMWCYKQAWSNTVVCQTTAVWPNWASVGWH